MKIRSVLYITHAGGTPYHGPNMRGYYLAREFLKRDIKVTIISSGFFHKYFNVPKVNKKYTIQNIDGIQYVWVRTLKYVHGNYKQILNQFQFTLSVFSLLHKIRSFSPDVIIASSPHPFVFLPSKYFSLRLKIPVIFEIRDLWPLAITSMSSISKYHPYIMLLTILEMFIYKFSDHLVTVKEGDIEHIVSKNRIKRDHITYIANGYGQLNNNSVTRDSIKIPENKFIVGYTGSFTTSTNMKPLIQAAEIIQNESLPVHFILIGKGNKKKELQEYVESKIIDNVSFTGPFSHEIILNIINKFDICYVGVADAQPYKHGLSCNKTFDYMYCEKPILASINTKSQYDPIYQSKCGISVQCGDINEIVNSIIKLYKMKKEELNNMGKNGKRFLMKNNLYSILAEKYINLFQRII